MDEKPIDHLSDGQKQCLRLVLRAMTSKEIGRLLGISSHTVDQRLKGAIRLLGASGRTDAARMLEAYELQTPYQSLVHQPAKVAIAPESFTFGPSDRQAGGQVDNVLREDQRPFELHAWETPPGWLPFPIRKGQRNELSLTLRLLWMLAGGFLCILAVYLFAESLAVLNRLDPERSQAHSSLNR